MHGGHRFPDVCCQESNVGSSFSMGVGQSRAESSTYRSNVLNTTRSSYRLRTICLFQSDIVRTKSTVPAQHEILSNYSLEAAMDGATSLELPSLWAAFI